MILPHKRLRCKPNSGARTGPAGGAGGPDGGLKESKKMQNCSVEKAP